MTIWVSRGRNCSRTDFFVNNFETTSRSLAVAKVRVADAVSRMIVTPLRFQDILPFSYVVDFTGPDDPMHGQNWPLRKKLVTAMVLGYTTLIAAGRLRLCVLPQ